MATADFSETATTVEEVAIGAAESAAEAASHPVASARRQAKTFERKGTPAARRINRRLSALMPDKMSVFGLEVNGKLPEKIAVKGLQMVKLRARRQDMVGGFAKRTLRIFNGSFKTIARTATRLEQATELNAQRNGESKASKPRARRRTARRTV
jgi:hypothetical protein